MKYSHYTKHQIQNYNFFFNLLENPIHNLDKTHNIIYIGGFNIDAQKQTHLFTTLQAFMTQNNMFLLNEKPTTIYGSALDH